MTGIVVQNTATNPGGEPLANTWVHISLVTGTPGGAGYLAASDILSAYTVRTDATGHWSATLNPNSLINPANTFYQVTEGSTVSDFTVPASGGPYNLSQLIVTPPTPSAPGIAGVQVAVGGTVQGVRPELNLIAGTNVTIAGADNAASNRVDVTINASGGSTAPAYVFSPASYGAKGDGKMVTDGAMTSGSAVLACTTSTPFVAGDAGPTPKYAMVKGAGPTGVTTLVAPIQSFTDSGHVVLATAASTTVTGAIVMFATDDTAAFQAAVNAAVAYAQAHGGYAEVDIPPAANQFYGIAGPLSHANLGNAQIALPVIPVAADTVTLVFKGAESGNAIRHWDQTVPQISGSCLVSFGAYASIGAQTADINTYGQSAMIGGPTGPNGYGTASYLFSNMLVVFKGLSLLTTHSAYGLGYGAAWLWGVDQADLTDVGYGTTGVFNNGNGELGGSGVNTLSSGASIGIGLPATSNQNNVTLRGVTCGGGYTFGLLATEHTDMQGCHVFYCWAGLCPVGSWHDGGGVTANNSSHKIRFTQVGIEGCVHSVYVLGSGASGIGPFMEGSIDSEAGTAWADDGHGGLAGALGEIHLSGTTGGTLTLSGGTGLTIIDERSPNGPGAAWTLTVGTPFQNPQWRWATVLLRGGTSLTGIQEGTLRGGPSAPTMTSYYSQTAGALPPITVRVPPGGWLEVTGTGSPTAPTATVVYD